MIKGTLLHESRRSLGELAKADKKAQQLGRKWFTDITQAQCMDGKLYIAPIFDSFCGEIVSLAMDTNMRKEQCMKAVTDAFESRRPGSGVINHSDAGSQYTRGE